MNETEKGFLVLWKTEETLDWCRENALRSHVVFPRGWNSWKNEIKQKQALVARLICMDKLGQGEIFYEQNGKPTRIFLISSLNKIIRIVFQKVEV